MVTHRLFIYSTFARLLLRPVRVKSANATPKCLHQCPVLKGRTVLGAVIFAGVFTLFVAPLCTAQEPDPASLSDEELQAEMFRVRQEADALANSPDAPEDWKALKAAQEEIGRIDMEREKEKMAVRQRVQRLVGSEAAQEWSRRVAEAQDVSARSSKR